MELLHWFRRAAASRRLDADLPLEAVNADV